MGLLESPVGGGFSTVSVGKVGSVGGFRPSPVRVFGTLDRGDDFVGDACGPRCEATARSLLCSLRPTGFASLSQRPLPLPQLPTKTRQHSCCAVRLAPVPTARPGAKRQATAKARRRHACAAGTQDWDAPGLPGEGDAPAGRYGRSALAGAGRVDVGEFSGRFPPVSRSGQLSAPCSARAAPCKSCAPARYAGRYGPLRWSLRSGTCPCNLACPSGTVLKAC